MSENRTLLLGAHLSIAKGFAQAIIDGESIGCTAIQIFTKSNRQWVSKELSAQTIHAFQEIRKNSSIKIVVAHASYLINIASLNPLINEKSMLSLESEIRRCIALGIPYLVVHPGARGLSSEIESLKKIAQTLDAIFDKVEDSSCMVLLETMAGQGSVIGYTFEQLAKIYELSSHKDRLGFCVDTCHIFAAGYDFTTPESYKDVWDHFDRIIGLEHLKVIHVNDSKKEKGSFVDRHEHIAKGKIGPVAFELLMNDPNLFDIPKIIETPKESLTEDFQNITTLKSLLTDQTKKLLLLE